MKPVWILLCVALVLWCETVEARNVTATWSYVDASTPPIPLDGFVMTRRCRPAGGTFSAFQDIAPLVPAVNRSHVFVQLEDTECEYVLYAYNGVGRSGPSNTALLATFRIPPAPGQLQLTADPQAASSLVREAGEAIADLRQDAIRQGNKTALHKVKTAETRNKATLVVVVAAEELLQY